MKPFFYAPELERSDMDQDKIEQQKMAEVQNILMLFERAKEQRQAWESHWQDCYDYTLPERKTMSAHVTSGSKHHTQIYDATALNAADQLGSSMLSELTPPWSSWFSLVPGSDMDETLAIKLAPVLEHATQTLQDHFDRSNLSVEIHQSYMDLVTIGTASLLVEEADAGSYSALKFSAIPMYQIYFLEGDDGRLSNSFRVFKLSVQQIRKRFGDLTSLENEKEDLQVDLLESVKHTKKGVKYDLILLKDDQNEILETGTFKSSPFVNFRWSKSPGEVYGRSPVMKALPDIKTANKVVELVLKNASIAVTGIWQADDDGVLNPANIKLKPGTIIPKAVGSAGLKPLEMPGNFDVSQLVLEDLRGRIKNALLADKLSPLTNRQMSATEVLERASEVTRILGATYGRLQSELLFPLIKRSYEILRRRGEVEDIPLDGRMVTVRYTSPLAQAQGSRDLQNVLSWAQQISVLGEASQVQIRTDKIIRYAAKTLGIPADFVEEVSYIESEVEHV